MTLKIDIEGKRFCRLTVLGEAGRTNKVITWLCACDCGKQVIVRGTYLRSGKTRSCGCIAEKHGHARRGSPSIPEYKIWVSMRMRCNNPLDAAYQNYGGRGIKVCGRWDDFSNFIADMGRRPSDDHSIERIKNGLGYSKPNCKWATRSEQNRNTRVNRIITFRGRSMPLIEASEISGIHYDTLKNRLFRLGWPVEKAMTEPVRG